MELTKFDGFAICSDTVTGSHGDFMITVLLGHDPDVTPNCFDTYSGSDKETWAENKWFFGVLKAKVELKVGSQSVLLDDVAAVLGGIEVNKTENNAHLDVHARELAQDALEQGIEIVEQIKTAA
ncbi:MULTISPECIES: hypothetical protein [Halomonadaceae]|uniref:Uncharacterized protein n=1 Tax=Vreelandella neptunia TaxID=115551 RepID=A0ABS9SCQ3_9GAMM|nr:MULTISPECIES: hypothetical protein [Halomonadaceae]MCH4813879.1 hypothetical protein [Halomonas neptunia]MEA2118903.1 hypothetical protein [Halovibrio sp. HP20-59]